MNPSLRDISKDSWNNPVSKVGEDFEDYVADHYFPDSMYEILRRTHDLNTNSKRFIRASLDPDFQFEIRGSDIQFWVECKHRQNNLNSSLITIFQNDQLARYKSYPNSLLLLCTYMFDDCYLFLVPFKDIKYNDLYFSFLKNYQLTLHPPVQPGLIKKYLFGNKYPDSK